MKKIWRVILILSLLGNLSIIYVGVKALEYRAHINEYLDKYNNVVNEFSRRDRYTSENSGLRSDTLVPGRVVLFGSQVVENWPVDLFRDKYPVINRGVSAKRASGFLLRFRPDVIELKPEAVVIEISSYNLRQESSVREISDYMSGLIESALYHGIKPIPATMIPPLRDSVQLSDYHIMDSITLYNDWLKNYCAGNSIEHVDFNLAVCDSNGYLSSEYAAAAIDLNRRGYEELTKLLSDILK